MNYNMKIALMARQEQEYLAKADEINVDYRDRDYIFDLYEKYPDKKYVLNLMQAYDGVDWNWIDQIYKFTDNLILRTDGSYLQMQQCAENGYKFFAGKPINDWAVLQAYKELDPVYVIPAGELFFNLPEVKKYGIPIRITPNAPYIPTIIAAIETPVDLTIPSEWMRPDDVDAYAEYVDTIEFTDVEYSKERALYRLYMEQKHWPGDLSMIITGLKTNATNRLLEPELTARRIDCKRKCLSGGVCRLCFRLFSLAQYEKIKKYKEAVLDS